MNKTAETALKAIAHPVRRELNLFKEKYQTELFSEPLLRDLFSEIPEAHMGKWIRPIFFFLCQGATGTIHPESTDVAVLIEMLHQASLIHDDVVDGASTRRGQKTLNALWGSKISVLAGDYLMARVLYLARQVRWPDVSPRLADIVLRMTRGELNQALQQRNPDPSLDAYLSISGDKTASLFSLAGDLAGLISDSDLSVREGLHSFGEHFGLAFQMQDDILDYGLNGQLVGKPVGNDFLDGLINLPAILALEDADQDLSLQFMMHLKKRESGDWDWAREFVISRGGVKEAEKMAVKTMRTGEAFLRILPSSPCQDALSRLLSFEIERKI
jgi:geranylgeranyl pyrophosphate synthase